MIHFMSLNLFFFSFISHSLIRYVLLDEYMYVRNRHLYKC